MNKLVTLTFEHGRPVPEFLYKSFSSLKQAENAHLWKRAFSTKDKRGSETWVVSAHFNFVLDHTNPIRSFWQRKWKLPLRTVFSENKPVREHRYAWNCSHIVVVLGEKSTIKLFPHILNASFRSMWISLESPVFNFRSVQYRRIILFAKSFYISFTNIYPVYFYKQPGIYRLCFGHENQPIFSSPQSQYLKTNPHSKQAEADVYTL